MEGRKCLGLSVIHSKDPLNLRLRENRTVVLQSMAIGAGLIAISLYIRLMTTLVYPGLTDGVDSMRPAGWADRNRTVADRALGNLRNIALQLLRIHIVIGLKSGVFRMRRTVAS